ncbi:MAG: type II toxin-antitoxin system RelE/ParE family toxin [Micromonosporaceae bacterium]|nr:type II toxin-antitoxin system RelE/ParE family toxin [Micromonosporaceae bacterium]
MTVRLGTVRPGQNKSDSPRRPQDGRVVPLRQSRDAERGPLLGEPYTRQLDGKLRELRFYLDQNAVRISYWIATDRRIILLTVFRKTRIREDQEIARARRALARCRSEVHTVGEEDERA